MTRHKLISLHQFKRLVLALFVLGFIYDVVLLMPVSDISLLVIIALLIGSIIIWKIDGTTLIKHSVWLAILCSIFAVLEYNRFSERLAIWWYIFFSIGTLQLAIIHLKKDK